LVLPDPNSNPSHNPIAIIIEKKSSVTSTLSSVSVHDPRLMSEAELQYWSHLNDAWVDATTSYLRTYGMAAIDYGLTSEEDLTYWSEVNEAWRKNVNLLICMKFLHIDYLILSFFLSS
jgi:hypothetical protein